MHLGIDLGTSNSAIAGVKDGRTRIFKTPEGTDVMPSIIHRDRRGNQTVGVKASDRASLAPENAVDGFKRLMGTDTPMRFASTNETISPEAASAEILKSLIGQALIETGTDDIGGVVVTIPAAFNQMQNEATMAAARAAGLDRVGLLQEPVAAALAAMAGAADRNGLILVYDLGGGTFDAALVQAIDGDVTVLGHEGVNSLGGRDLDRRLMESHALPWLKRTFDLPSNFAVDPTYARLLRMIRRSAETAKIALSTRDATTINASDDEVRLVDMRGEPIYLDVPLRRTDLEAVAAEMITRSVACCRDMLAHAQFRHEDVSRIVLIGGPTKMPFLRKDIEHRLGIVAEDAGRVDPMTAVATGAAIYCEGRDWSSSGSTARPSHHAESVGQDVSVTFDYEARTASHSARLTVRQTGGEAGAEVLVESILGWSSERRSLAEAVAIDLPLRDPGPNRFWATVFGAAGLPVPEACRTLMVERLLATTGGIPAAHTVAVRIVSETGRNELSPLITKGTILPASGVQRYRLAQPLRCGSGEEIRIDLYQVGNPLVADHRLHLLVGYFVVKADDLPPSMALRKGDQVIIHWVMTEDQLIRTEVEFPDVRQRFNGSNFHSWQVGRQNFSGDDGGSLADGHVEQAEEDLNAAEDAAPPARADQLVQIRVRLDDRRARLRETYDPDTRRGVVEDVRLLRQEIAMACDDPEARRHLLRLRLQRQRDFHQRDIRANATADQVETVDALISNAEATIQRGDFDTAAQLINRMIGVYWTQGLGQVAFCAGQYARERSNRHLARDPGKFDADVSAGDEALRCEDHLGVRRALVGIILGQAMVGADANASNLAALTRA